MRPLEVTRRRGLLGRVRKGPRENNPRPRNVGFSQNILFVKGEKHCTLNCTLISGPGDGKSRKIGSRQGNRVYNCPCLGPGNGNCEYIHAPTLSAYHRFHLADECFCSSPATPRISIQDTSDTGEDRFSKRPPDCGS